MTFSKEFRTLMGAFEASTDFKAEFNEETGMCTLDDSKHDLILANEKGSGIICMSIILEELDDDISKEEALNIYRENTEGLSFMSIFLVGSKYITYTVPVLQPMTGLKALMELLAAEGCYKAAKKKRFH